MNVGKEWVKGGRRQKERIKTGGRRKKSQQIRKRKTETERQKEREEGWSVCVWVGVDDLSIIIKQMFSLAIHAC